MSDALGPEYDLESAAHFFKALRAYPVPLELLMAYENTVPPRILKVIIIHSEPM